MVKQSVDATFADIRKRELLAELELRVIEVQCSAPVMWIAPSKWICNGFPMIIRRDPCPSSTSSVIPANEDTSTHHQNSHLSLCVSQASSTCRHRAHIPCLQGDRRLRVKSQNHASTSINDQQANNLFIFTSTLVLIGSGALDSSGLCKLYQILCSILLIAV